MAKYSSGWFRLHNQHVGFARTFAPSYLIAPYHRDERDLLFEHLAALEAGCLLLLDMGYPAFRVFAALHERKIAWCARVALDTWSVVRDFLAAGQDDAVVMLHPRGEALADCRARGVPTTPI